MSTCLYVYTCVECVGALFMFVEEMHLSCAQAGLWKHPIVDMGDNAPLHSHRSSERKLSETQNSLEDRD